MAPPQMRDYLLNVILSSNVLMKKISREFAVPDPSAIIPEPLGVEDEARESKRNYAMQQVQKQMQQLMAA